MAIIYPEKKNIEKITGLFPSSDSLIADIESIIKKRNILVVKEEMEYGMSGYIEKRQSEWVIGVNKYDSPLRQKFTLAHELGHYILHKSEITSKHEDYILLRDNEYTAMEREANEFAAELLMPRDKFRNCVESREATTIKDLAQKFEVSANAVRYRAYKLGYINRV